MDHQPRDLHFMDVALDLAGRIAVRPWPNPPVGAVVVRDEAIVGRGNHAGPGHPHAERIALAEAGERARDAELFLTLEPCNHQGRTPPCTSAVIDAGIRRVVIGALDPNPHVVGGGAGVLRDAGLDVISDVRGRICREMIKPFTLTRNFERPFVTLKTAFSRDGFVAPPSASRRRIEPVYLTGEAALDDVHRLRRWHDVVLVGTGTLRADRPRLDGRRVGADAPVPQAEPLPAAVDARLEAAPDWRQGEHLILTSEHLLDGEAAAALRCRGARLLGCRETPDGLAVRDMIAQLFKAGGRTILLECGPRLAVSFLQADLVDSWIQYVSPEDLGTGLCWIGGPGVPRPRNLSLADERLVGRDRRLTWDRPASTEGI